jgi:serine phosphatase RsbU (regulator of sigma subunit)/CHASE2 domain-containing sensor protein
MGRWLWTRVLLPCLAHRGRLLAFLALLGVCLLHPFLEGQPFVLLQNIQFDTMQRLSPRVRDEMPALVVAIDEKSLAALGQWPWPRQTLAALLEKIGAGEPHAIGVDIIFPEADRLGPQSLTRLYPQLKSARLPDPDARLATALAATPSVLGLAASQHPAATPVGELHVAPVISRGGDVREAASHFSGALRNLPLLEAAARSQALLNSQADPGFLDSEQGVLRRIPLIATVGDLPVASLGPEMLRLALGAPAVEAQLHNGRIRQVGVDTYQLPTLENGELFLHFGAFRADRYLSAVDVLQGRVGAENFHQRFVLLGFAGLGLQDQVLTPLGEKVPGVEIHAQVLESLWSGAALTRPHWLRALERGLLAGLGLLLIVFMPRLNSMRAITLGLVLPVLVFALAYAAFATLRLLVDAINLLILLAPVFFILQGHILIQAEHQRRRAEGALADSRKNAVRIAGELEAARRIQMGLLPDPASRFAGETRFQVAACLEPAREVGGDYFDCFMLDEARLCLVVGDVSGKGLPASLFMAVAKSLGGMVLRQHPDDLAAALVQLDGALARNNQESMFVTTFVGVFNVESGVLDYVCAGHDAPWRLRRNAAGEEGQVERIAVANISGPPLGTYAGFPYQRGSAKLSPGDSLLLTTDGVTEASNGEEWFGSVRLESWLKHVNPAADAREWVEALRQEVRNFEVGYPPMDDLTLLALQWRGPEGTPGHR